MWIMGVVCLVLAVLRCYGSALTTDRKALRIHQAAALFFFAFGADLTGMSPHILATGVALFVLSFLRLIREPIATTLFRTGYLSAIAALLIVVVNLFENPSRDKTENEDRSDFKPDVVAQKTPQELLAQEWSTYDQNCTWPVAKLMLDLSEIAYEAPVDAKEKIRKLGFESESINAGAMQRYVIDAGDDSIVTLRGTESHEYDILQDLRFLKSHSEQGSMHGGFASGYNPMHDQVVKLLERYGTKRVWLTGHSLGGGLAIVCARRLLVDEKYPIAGIMTFGQPRVVRRDLADFLGPKLDGKYVFFVNDMDPVTRLIPPYEHFGHMVRWTDSGIERSIRFALLSSSADETAESPPPIEAGYVEEMSDSELNTLIDELEASEGPVTDVDGNLVVKGFFPSANDHKLASYREMLDRLQTHAEQR
jgi:hypothetical protein